MEDMLIRPRRLRKSAGVRTLVQESSLVASDLVLPLFVLEGTNRREAIESMPHVYRMSKDLVVKEAERVHAQGVQAVALFPVVEKSEKDERGSYALKRDGLIPQTLALLKRELPSLIVITDLALDPFTSHGHDGLLASDGSVANDATVDLLAEMALLHAACGADIVAPSDMMDGRVGVIRRRLEAEGFSDVAIMSYTAKYASSLYAPFRTALGSGLKTGDKKGYQMNPANRREALLEARLDAEEGADILLVKPALFYLDVIAKMRQASLLPIAAYHVSGEYAMVMSAEERGWLNAREVFLEALLSIKRAGADFILSYATPLVLELL